MKIYTSGQPEFSQLLTQFYGNRIGEFFRNFGPGAFVTILNDKSIPRSPFNVNIAGSAGDKGPLREDLSTLEPKCRVLGIKIAEYFDRYAVENSVDPVLSTGACPFVGEWITKEVADRSKFVYIVGLAPDLWGVPLDPSNIPEHLRHYDALVYTDMPVCIRTPLVGALGKGLINAHGGYGSLAEVSTSVDEGGVAAMLKLRSTYGVSNSGVEILKAVAYKNTDGIFFRNSDPDFLVKRILAEIDIKDRGLVNGLTALVVYDHTHKDGGGSVLQNVRPTRKPSTFYHNGKWVKPVDHTLIAANHQEVRQVMQRISDPSKSEIWAPRPMEVPEILHTRDLSLEEAVNMANRTRNEFGDRVVWHHQH